MSGPLTGLLISVLVAVAYLIGVFAGRAGATRRNIIWTEDQVIAIILSEHWDANTSQGFTPPWVRRAATQIVSYNQPEE